jgi:hypothetical protein
LVRLQIYIYSIYELFDVLTEVKQAGTMNVDFSYKFIPSSHLESLGSEKSVIYDFQNENLAIWFMLKFQGQYKIVNLDNNTIEQNNTLE